MLLLSLEPPHLSLSRTSLFHHHNNQKHHNCCPRCCNSNQKPLLLSSSSSNSLRFVNEAVLDGGGGGGGVTSASAAAVAAVISKASTSPVEFTEKIEKDPKSHGIVLPSADFQRLCIDQLDLFRRIVDPSAILSVYVRPAGSYVMDRLELRGVTFYPTTNTSDIVILVGNFSIPTGLRAAETTLSNQQAEAIPECRALVFPMVKRPFVVGFLVAELPNTEMGNETHDIRQLPSPEECYALPPGFDLKSPDNDSSENPFKYFNLTADQRLNAINISCTLATAYVMDQKAMLLQQTSWQDNIRMSTLVEQIRGPLSTIQTLTKMLSIQMKRSEIASDIVEDILVQGDRMRDTLHQLQDAVHLTKANIMRFNEGSLKKMRGSHHSEFESTRHQLPDNLSGDDSGDKSRYLSRPHSLSSAKDSELPMPPLALAPTRHHSIRPCNVSNVLVDLVGAVEPLAHKQKRAVQFNELSQSLQVAIEEPALRQALGNLIEGALLRTHVGGRVEIVSMGAPAGGALVIIDDDGPDMHYMTQMHSLTPFGAKLFSEQKVEDNMTWNFIAGLTVAREILESYGCVVRVISPRNTDAALGAGGTRVEVWLPSLVPPTGPSEAA